MNKNLELLEDSRVVNTYNFSYFNAHNKLVLTIKTTQKAVITKNRM